jgi:hypothetical protein
MTVAIDCLDCNDVGRTSRSLQLSLAQKLSAANSDAEDDAEGLVQSKRSFLRSIRPRFMAIMLWLGVVEASVHVVVPMFSVTAMNTALPCGLSDAVAVVQ